MPPADLSSFGLAVPAILLPNKEIDLSRWAVVACDQYTAEPAYWDEVARLVGEAPSALHLVFPEAYLGLPDADSRIESIHRRMREYLAAGVLAAAGNGLVYVERQTGRGSLRRGLLAAVDLERYDYRPGARTLIRATEGTVLERIPARVRIRVGAPLEIPHVMLLYDDPEHRIIGPLAELADSSRLPELYRVPLMMSGGQLRGFLADTPGPLATAAAGLGALAARARATGEAEGGGEPMLLAVGDGNHSLAAAKTVWENLKRAGAAPDHPARHALVELVNLHDAGLEFAPIHRLVFGLVKQEDLFSALVEYCRSAGADCAVTACACAEEAASRCREQARIDPGAHCFPFLTRDGAGFIAVRRPPHTLAVGTLQLFLDELCRNRPTIRVDYIHGDRTLATLAAKPGHVGFFLPPLAKADLFSAVIAAGVLPKKTFSMGEAEEKRFYMECRRIV